MPPAIFVEQLNVRYDTTPVLWDIDLQLPEGMLIGVAGPNGAGKSTLVKAALGLVEPSCGRVLFWGKPFREVRKRVGYMPQKESVDWDFPITVEELVLMGSLGRVQIGRSFPKEEYHRAHKYLQMMGLLPFKDRQINELSGGQKQRAFLARAWMQEADLYIMDEPFVGIDAATEELIWDRLDALKKQGKTVIIIHHNLETLKRFVDWAVLLNVRLIASGPRDEVLTPENLAQAFGGGFSLSLYEEALALAEKKAKGERLS